MAEIKLIKDRIGSVKSTAQLTKAMQLISASKMVKAQERSVNTLPYAEMIYAIARQIGDPGEYSSPFLRKDPHVKNICLVVVGTGRGFVGGMIAELTMLVNRLNNQLQKRYPNAVIHGISIHNTALRILQRCNVTADLHFKEYFENLDSIQFAPIYEAISDRFANKEYDLVYIVYTHFINTIVQKAYYKKLLPISVKQIREEFSLALYEGDASIKENSAEAQNELIGKNGKIPQIGTGNYKFEPSLNTVLDFLLPEYFRKQIYAAVLESIASEHSARMVAMKNATDNADKLKHSLTLKYNRERQAQITQQLIEVVNGRSKRESSSIF